MPHSSQSDSLTDGLLFGGAMLFEADYPTCFHLLCLLRGRLSGVGRGIGRNCWQNY
jgi:hypothetical protein